MFAFLASIPSTGNCQNSTKILFFENRKILFFFFKSSILKVFDNCCRSIFLCAATAWQTIYQCLRFHTQAIQQDPSNWIKKKRNAQTFWVVLPHFFQSYKDQTLKTNQLSVIDRKNVYKLFTK